MKFICEKNILMKGISSVISGISIKRNTILDGILITTKDNQIILKTYNEEIGIEYTLNAEIVDKGQTVIQAQTFAEIIRRMPDTKIEFTYDKENNVLVVSCEGSEYKLATMNAEDFPELPKVVANYSFDIEQKTLRNLIKQTIFATSTDEKRKIYTGCLFDVDNKNLVVVALDGIRLAIRKALIHSENEFKMIVPSRTLNELTKILEDSFELVKVGFSNNQAIFEFENCKVITKLLEGDFYNYRNLLSMQRETRVKVNRANLLDTIERIALISSPSVAKEQKGGIYINLEIGKMRIDSISSVGEAKEEMFVETSGKEQRLKFNPKYFLDVLKVISDEEIIIDFGTSNTPTNIKPVEEDDSFNYIVTPVQERF